ncbi:MAG: hypothetical protein NMK33_02715 [Candidatus Cardinium sp.]|uniref:sodium:solute symporter family transporter n=1 Tax=Cardinium endosymbiont of Dermatophagoides farinae TaxID=2597823 RepID=UPI00118308C7|nr:hypothetical protein [Cardinium endosymbiont of Dermatophagoides farinae]TSJ81385.1 hypothetical protein FPG78_05390 [Cardinium endosymbiont of Dermatophagoides farinae]UWW97450.1 MAG: hypothetical protein NMK33_02715 [Candidatus Cardinium sp.]
MGGIKAVTITDMVQLFIFMVTIPLITYNVVYHVGGIEALFLKVPSKKFLILGHERFYRYMIYFFIWLLQIGMVDPAVVQRMLMAKDKRQLRSKYMIISLFDPAFRFLVLLYWIRRVGTIPGPKIQYGCTTYHSNIVTNRHKRIGYSWSIGYYNV